MSKSVRPHRGQPTRLPCPWDSLGKNTGMGCHFLLQCMKVKSESEVAQSCPTLCDPMDTRLLRPWDFLGKSTGVGCRFLLQGTSQPRDRTQVSHIVDRRFPSEPPLDLSQKAKKRKRSQKEKTKNHILMQTYGI